MARIAARLGRRPALLPIPFAFARPAAWLMELLPRAPLTLAQVELLESDNLPAGRAPGLAQLGIAPRRLDEAIAALAR
jgi:NADH dehydrogenase